MTKLYAQKVLNIQMMTEKQLNSIVKIWLKTFGEDVCNENLDKLYNHCKSFYEGIIKESVEKEEEFAEEIKSLWSEVERICWLLNMQNSLLNRSIAGVPQLVIKSDLENYLSELNEVLNQRQKQLVDLLAEQRALCQELGTEERSLLQEPLPTEADINNFKQYLDTLKNEREDRLKKFLIMRNELKSFLHSLEIDEETEDSILRDDQPLLTMENFNFLQKLHEYYSKRIQHKKINDLYIERLKLCERMAALLVKTTDPSRYNNRGGQLLKEEKERNLILAAKPKIEQKLHQLLTKYEQEENKPYLLNGENIRDVMEKEWPQNNDLLIRRCDISLTPGRIKTPSSSKLLSTPRSAKDEVNPSKIVKQKVKRSLSCAEFGLSPNMFFKSTNSPGVTSLKSPLITANENKVAKKLPVSCSKINRKADNVKDYAYFNTFVPGIKAKSRSTLLPKLNRRESLKF